MALTAACIIYQNASLTQLEGLLSVIDQAGIAPRAVWVNAAIEAPIRELCEKRNVTLLGTGGNLGVGAALNRFCAWASQHKTRNAIAFDQDSLITVAALCALQHEFEDLQTSKSNRCAAIGPRLIDARTGQPMAQFAPYTWQRKPLTEDMKADHLITSCMLFDLSVYEAIGLFNEAYFVDLVDIEWCLRARALGYDLRVSRTAELRQSIGIATRKIPGRALYVHRPDRNFYQVRNALWLIRFAPIRPARRLNEIVHLILRITHILIFGDNRKTRLKKIYQGFIAGLATRKN